MTIKVHHLRPAPGAKTEKMRVGRGEGSKGKTAGRGTKGTKARYQVPERFEGGQMPLHMRLPKLKGFRNPFKVEFQVVNLDKLGELFPEGGAVGVDDREAHAVLMLPGVGHGSLNHLERLLHRQSAAGLTLASRHRRLRQLAEPRPGH